MKLSTEQIERLYQFTRQHYVEYYDLQTELVDHLAHAIEQRWTANPHLDFETTLQSEFKKFGVFGFMEVVEKRRAALEKKYNKMVCKELKSFFSIPKIIGTLFSMGIVFYLLKLLQAEYWLVQCLFCILILSYLLGLAILMRKNKKKYNQNSKKWLLKDIIFGYSSWAGLIQVPLQFVWHLDGEKYHDGILLLLSLILITIGLVEYITLVLIPSKAEDFLIDTYPEYKITT